jgi:histidinol phosphatase-like enzyme (inositol monophosphatase family)
MAVEVEPSEIALFAHALADAARAQSLPRWIQGCAAMDKANGGEFDPVTAADVEAERAMRALIEGRFPDHAIHGEEQGSTPGAGRFGWSLDPVDGTRSFICGLPNWVTLIAFLDDGLPVFGLIDAPALGERYWGAAAGGRFSRAGIEARLQVSGCTRLGEARVSTTDPFLFAGSEASAFDRVRRSTRTLRYGHDGYAYARLAAGTIDLVIESGLKPHDYNALIPVVRAAGGAISDWHGGTDFAAGRIVAAASAELLAEVLSLLTDSD